MAFGVGNIASGLTGGFTVGSSTSRTAAVAGRFAKPLPSIVTSVGTLLLVLFGTALLEHIPNPAIGAVVPAARHLGVPQAVAAGPRGVRRRRRLLPRSPVPRPDRRYRRRVHPVPGRPGQPRRQPSRRGAQPHRHRERRAHPGHRGGADERPGLVIVRFAAPIFFANSTELGDQARKAVRGGDTTDTPVSILVPDLETVTDVDVTGAENLETLIEWLRDREVSLGYSRARPEILARLEHLGLLEGATVYPTNRAAVLALAVADE